MDLVQKNSIKNKQNMCYFESNLSINSFILKVSDRCKHYRLYKSSLVNFARKTEILENYEMIASSVNFIMNEIKTKNHSQLSAKTSTQRRKIQISVCTSKKNLKQRESPRYTCTFIGFFLLFHNGVKRL